MVRGLDKVLAGFKGLDEKSSKSLASMQQQNEALQQSIERNQPAIAKLKETLGEKFDPQAFDAYNRALDNTRAKLEREKGYRVVLGANFDKRAFQASERELAKIKRQTESVRVEHNRLGPTIAGAFKGSDRHVKAFSNALGGAAHQKDGPLRDQTFMMARLAAILWRFLELHESCVARAAGVEGFDVVATVPSSTSQRDQVSNLRTLAGWCAPISDRLERLLEPTGDVVGRSFSTSRYRAVRPLVGERVLLLDDTWTAGGHAQSAGFTLKDNGGRAVALVAIGRHLQPAWTPAVPDGPTCAELWEGLPRVFDWGACAVHGR